MKTNIRVLTRKNKFVLPKVRGSKKPRNPNTNGSGGTFKAPNTNQNSNNKPKNSGFVFDLKGLTPKHQKLIICDTEKDAQIINKELSLPNVLATYKPPFKKTLPVSNIEGLKARFSGGVYLLFDSRNNGLSLSLAISHSIYHIDFLDCIDFQRVSSPPSNVWGAYVNLGKHILERALSYGLAVSYALPNYKDDPFSISVPHCFRLDFDNYLGENKPNQTGRAPSDILEHLILRHPKLILQSCAGTGKSTFLIKLANTKLHYNSLDCDYLVIIEPKTSIATQLHKDFLKGLSNEYSPNDIALIKGGVNSYELESAKDAKIIICVYDSLEKIASIIPKSFLVIDEFHEISKDQNYRQIPMFGVWEFARLARRKVLLSATPNYLLTTNLHPDFNYKLVIGKDKAPNKFALTIKRHNSPKRQLLDYIESNLNHNKKGVTLIKFDNDKTLSAYKNNLDSRKIKNDYLTSKRKESKENNLNYNSIMERGLLAENLAFLLFTSLLESGVSFKFAVRLMCVFDARSWQSIIQLAARARHDKARGVNLLNDIWLFASKGRNEPTPNPQNIKARFKRLLAISKAHANQLNGLETGGEITLLASSDLKPLTRERLSSGYIEGRKYKTYVPDIPAILHELYKQETKECTLELLVKRITRFDSRFSVIIEDIKTVENHTFKNELDALRQGREKDKDNFLKTLKTQTTNTLHAVCYLSKNPEFKERVKRELKLPLMPKDRIVDFIEENKSSFAYDRRARAVNTLCSLVGAGESINKALESICSLDTKDLTQISDAKTIQRRHNISATKQTTLSAPDKLQCKIDKSILKTFGQVKKNMKKGRYKGGLSKDQIGELVNKSLQKVTPKAKLSTKKAFSRLRCLYELKNIQKRVNGARVRTYEIGARKFNLDRGDS